MLFCHTSHTDVASLVVSVRGAANLHTILSAGMYEGEGVIDGVYIHDDADMSDITTGMRTCEEYQVTRLHLLPTDRYVASILVT